MPQNFAGTIWEKSKGRSFDISLATLLIKVKLCRQTVPFFSLWSTCFIGILCKLTSLNIRKGRTTTFSSFLLNSLYLLCFIWSFSTLWIHNTYKTELQQSGKKVERILINKHFMSFLCKYLVFYLCPEPQIFRDFHTLWFKTTSGPIRGKVLTVIRKTIREAKNDRSQYATRKLFWQLEPNSNQQKVFAKL